MDMRFLLQQTRKIFATSGASIKLLGNDLLNHIYCRVNIHFF